jgi:hypothetical protein
MPVNYVRRLESPVRANVSEERSASIIRVTKIGELGTALGVTSNRRMLQKILCSRSVGC